MIFSGCFYQNQKKNVGTFYVTRPTNSKCRMLVIILHIEDLLPQLWLEEGMDPNRSNATDFQFSYAFF